MSSGRCIISTESNKQCTYKKFTVTPAGYRRSCVTNLILFTIVNAVAFSCIEKNLDLSYSRKRVVCLIFTILSLVWIRNPTIESLSVFKNAGIQVSRTQGCVLLPTSLNIKLFEREEFIPKDRIVDIIINEGFQKGFQVIFYLAVILKDTSKLLVVFPVCSTGSSVVKFLTALFQFRSEVTNDITTNRNLSPG